MKKLSKGFTLVELLASLAIITLILSVVIYNHREFDSQLELTNVAYRVAVSIREAQTYGIGAREFNGSFNIPYGVSFYNTVGSESNYVFFGDSNPNVGDHTGVYDGPVTSGCNGTSADPSDECIERITLGAGNFIKKVCALGNPQTNSGACIPNFYSTGGPYLGINSLNVIFKRPKSDALITASKYMSGVNNPVISPSDTLTEIYICLQSPSPQNKYKAVHVSSAGQISVEDVSSGSQNGICLF